MIPQVGKLRTKLQASTDPNQQARIQNRINFMRRQGAPGVSSGMAANTPNKAIKGLNTKLGTATDPNQQARINSRINFIQGRSGLPVTKQTPTTPTTGQPTTPIAGNTPTTPVPATPQAQQANPQNSQSIAEALFPSGRAMEASNYEGSPIYQWRLGEGQKQLDRLMASRGLLKSGAEIGANRDMVNQLTAQESETARGIAQKEADRLAYIQQAEANRLTGREDAQWNRYMDTLNFAAGQSPMNFAYGATGSLGNLYNQWGNTKAGYIGDQYPRYHAPSGGGGMPLPQWQEPFPSGPDFSQLDYFDILNNQANNDQLGGIANNIFASLF